MYIVSEPLVNLCLSVILLIIKIYFELVNLSEPFFHKVLQAYTLEILSGK
jgi:hypothetical protein